MRHFYFFLFLILVIGGCTVFEPKSEETVVKDFDVVNVKLQPDEEFVYSLGPLGDEEQAMIKEDGDYVKTSKLFYDFDGSRIVKYRYQPKPGFTGKDAVVLEVKRGSDGASPNTDIYYTALNFTVETVQ